MISRLYIIAIAALLGLTACGGSSDTPPPEPASAPASLHTGRVLLVGGNALIDYDSLTKTVSPRYFGPCVDNEGRLNGDSTTTLGVFQLGVLNSHPSRVVIVVDEFELRGGRDAWADLGLSDAALDAIVTEARQHALDNYTGAVVHAVASGARTTIVGVPEYPGFNSWLRGLALAYGAEYSDTLTVSCN